MEVTVTAPAIISANNLGLIFLIIFPSFFVQKKDDQTIIVLFTQKTISSYTYALINCIILSMFSLPLFIPSPMTTQSITLMIVMITPATPNTVNGILLWTPSPQYASMIPIEDRIMRLRIHFLRLLSICV